MAALVLPLLAVKTVKKLSSVGIWYMMVLSLVLPLLLSVVSLLVSFYFFYVPRLEGVWRRRIESDLDRAEIIAVWADNGIWTKFDAGVSAFLDFCNRYWGQSWGSSYKTCTRISILYTLVIFLAVFVFSDALPFRGIMGDVSVVESKFERSLMVLAFISLVSFFAFVLKFQRSDDYVGVIGYLRNGDYSSALGRFGKEMLGSVFALIVVVVLVLSVEMFLFAIGAIDLIFTSWISVLFILICFSVAYGLRLGSTSVIVASFCKFALMTIFVPSYYYYSLFNSPYDIDGFFEFFKPIALSALPLFTLFVLLPMINAFFDLLSLQATRQLVGVYRSRRRFNSGIMEQTHQIRLLWNA